MVRSPCCQHGRRQLYGICAGVSTGVALITEWRDENGNVEGFMLEKSDLGGTIRLGAQQCQLVDLVLVRQLAQCADNCWRHRHTAKSTTCCLNQIEDAVCALPGRSGDDQLVRDHRSSESPVVHDAGLHRSLLLSHVMVTAVCRLCESRQRVQKRQAVSKKKLGCSTYHGYALFVWRFQFN